jgi:hypothetical protein
LPNPYRQIVAHNGITYDAIQVVIDLTLPPALAGAPAPACPGTTMLNAAAANGHYFDPFLKLFHSFSDPANQGGWTWQGSAGGHTLSGLLDTGADAKPTGECLHFVENLYTLCRAPAPFGLGMRANEVLIPPKYEGAHGEGFVSAHPGVFINLPSNVLSPPGYAGPQLYLWANHKVLWIQSRDVYYDPCYRTNYQNLSDMAMYQIVGKEVQMNPNETVMTAFAEGRVAYKTERAGRLFYFRMRSTAEQAGNPARFEGPLTETQFEVRRQAAVGLRVV